jgi:hypothetical protein
VVHTRDADFVLLQGDALDELRALPDGSAACVVTSPPYLDARPEYDAPTAADYAAIFVELGRVVTGPMLWNVGRLWRDGLERLWWLDLVELAAGAGWQHWDSLVWVKLNPNPIQGRAAANAHEYVLVFGRPGVALNEEARRRPYAEGSVERLRRRWIASVSVKGDGAERSGARRAERRGERHDANPAGARAPSVIVTSTGREKGNPHPAPMPLALADELVLLGSWATQVVLDPFAGSGTTALAARRLGRRSVAIELNSDYCELAATRLQQQALFS